MKFLVCELRMETIFQSWWSLQICISTIYGLTIEPNNDQLAVGVIAQLVEHCTSIAEVWVWVQGPVSRKSREPFGPEKPFVKVRPAYSVKLIFSYVVKWIKIKITAKFRASRRLRFEHTKIIMSPEMRPKSCGTFEKQAPGPSCSKHGQRWLP